MGKKGGSNRRARYAMNFKVEDVRLVKAAQKMSVSVSVSVSVTARVLGCAQANSEQLGAAGREGRAARRR